VLVDKLKTNIAELEADKENLQQEFGVTQMSYKVNLLTDSRIDLRAPNVLMMTAHSQ